MVRESSKRRSIRLTDTVMNELNTIIEEDNFRTVNNLMENLIKTYKESKTTSYKKIKTESDILLKELSILKKDVSTLLYLNGTMGDFLSITEINEIEGDSLVNKSKEKVKRDIEKKQVNIAFKNN